jgi:hypothetical protein
MIPGTMDRSWKDCFVPNGFWVNRVCVKGSLEVLQYQAEIKPAGKTADR